MDIIAKETKELACFDIDETLSKSRIYLEVIKSENEAGFVANDYLKKINQVLADYKDGQIDYEETVLRVINFHAESLKGQKYSDLKAHADEFISNSNDKFRKFAEPVMNLLSGKIITAVVTAEPQYLAESIRKFLDIDKAFSTIFEVQNGVFNGKIENSLAASEDKTNVLESYSIVLAFGDSEGDVAMLEKAKHAFCISPTPGLRRAAEQNNWQIYNDNEDERVISNVEALI